MNLWQKCIKPTYTSCRALTQELILEDIGIIENKFRMKKKSLFTIDKVINSYSSLAKQEKCMDKLQKLIFNKILLYSNFPNHGRPISTQLMALKT